MKITPKGLVGELQQLYQTNETAARMLEGTLRHYFDNLPGGGDRVEGIIDLLEQEAGNKHRQYSYNLSSARTTYILTVCRRWGIYRCSSPVPTPMVGRGDIGGSKKMKTYQGYTLGEQDACPFCGQVECLHIDEKWFEVGNLQRDGRNVKHCEKDLTVVIVEAGEEVSLTGEEESLLSRLRGGEDILDPGRGENIRLRELIRRGIIKEV